MSQPVFFIVDLYWGLEDYKYIISTVYRHTYLYMLSIDRKIFQNTKTDLEVKHLSKTIYFQLEKVKHDILKKKFQEMY